MPLSKKELKELKDKLHSNNPKTISNIRNRTKVVLTNKEEAVKARRKIKKPKSIFQWNFNVNDLVRLKHPYRKEDLSIGLIVSDYIYHSARVEKNNFFVLVENAVIPFDGKYLRKI